MTEIADEQRLEIPKILVMGDLLWDCYPESKVLGGCMANVVYRLDRCSEYFRRFASPLLLKENYLEIKLLSAVGDDQLGMETITALSDLGVDTELTITSNYPTGVVNVTFDTHGEPMYEFPDRELSAFNHIGDAYGINKFANHLSRDLANTPDDLNDPRARLLRFASSASIMVLNGGCLFFENNLKLARFLGSSAKECWLDPNLRPGSYNLESLQQALKLASHVKLNHAELLEIGKLMSFIAKEKTDSESPGIILSRLTAEFQLRAIYVTKGKYGIDCYLTDDNFHVTRKISSNLTQDSVNVIDPVGAGDAITAVLVYASALEIDIQQALDVAHEVGARVVQTQGAMGAI